MSLVIDIADAVADELNAGTFSQTFIAERLYRPDFELAEMKTLHVSVVPKGIATSALSRGQNLYDVSIDVAIQKKLAAENEAEIDPLMALVEELADFFRLRRLTAVPAAVWLKTENLPVYAMEHLEQKKLFTSVLTFTFRVGR